MRGTVSPISKRVDHLYQNYDLPTSYGLHIKEAAEAYHLLSTAGQDSLQNSFYQNDGSFAAPNLHLNLATLSEN